MPLSSGWPSSIFLSNLHSVVGFCIITEELGFVSNGESSSSFNIIAYNGESSSSSNIIACFFIYFSSFNQRLTLPFFSIISSTNGSISFLNGSILIKSILNQPISGVPFGESTVDRCNLSFGGMSLILVYANQIVPFHFISQIGWFQSKEKFRSIKIDRSLTSP